MSMSGRSERIDQLAIELQHRLAAGDDDMLDLPLLDLGNNLVNIMATSLATTALLFLFGDAGVVYATFAMTLLILIFAEVAPKTALHSISMPMA